MLFDCLLAISATLVNACGVTGSQEHYQITVSWIFWTAESILFSWLFTVEMTVFAVASCRI